jgi:hypothetical protein
MSELFASAVNEPAQLRLSNKAYAILVRMKEDSCLDDMVDGYRLGIALALASGATPLDFPSESRNYIAVSTLDPNAEIAAAIRLLVNLQGQSVYRYAERLADWGIKEMEERFGGGFLDVASLMTQGK